MAVTSWIRRQFKNGVTLSATTTMTGAATSFSVNTGLGATFPDGSVGPFIVTVDQMLATEEKILCASRSGDTFAVAPSGRGYNGTTAQAHTNATVFHTIDAQDLDEANQTAFQTLGAISAPGDLLQGSGSNALARLARGTSGQFLQAGSSNLSWVTATAAMISGAADKTSGSTQAFTGSVSVGGNLTVTGTNTATLLSSVGGASVATSESTASTAYVDLTTPGPAVTVTTGANALVIINCALTNASGFAVMGFAVSGATTIAATDATSASADTSNALTVTWAGVVTGLTAGSNTFTAKYRVTAGTGTFVRRFISVIPLS